MDMSVPATLLLYAFLALGFFDGVVLHLIVFKLHKVPEARREHLIHTARTVLMAGAVALLFAIPTGGPLLWLGAGLMVLDFALGCWDAFIERDSRSRWGGLGRSESALHIALSVLHGGAAALILASRPTGAWSWDSPAALDVPLPLGEGMMYGLVPALIGLGVLHLVLLLPPFQRHPEDETAAQNGAESTS